MGSGEVLLLLGGNVGEVTATQERAVALIAERVGPVLARSRPHWTEPWGFSDPRPFLNQALLVRTALSPRALLTACLAIEHELGRVRPALLRRRLREGAAGGGYAARTIDIDILLIDGTVVKDADLAVPHPRLHERAFALAPAADVTPGWRHPVLGRTVLQLLDDLRNRR